MDSRVREETRLLFSLAWPCILENITTTFVSLADTAMVGSIGATATAAVGACTTPTWFLNGLVRSLGVGGAAIVARYIGAKDRNAAEKAACQVFRVSVLLAALISLFSFFGASLFPRVMRVSAEVVPVASRYVHILSCGFLFHYTAMCMGALLRGAGDTKTPMIAGIAANVINLIGNFFMIYPTRTINVFGLRIVIPGAGIGVIGAAIASAAALGFAGLYILIHMLRASSKLRIGFDLKTPVDRDLLQRVFKIAIPAALERISINIGQIIFAGYISSIGVAELAAYHIVTNIESIGYMPANGFQAAATTLVGQNLGAEDPAAARRFGWRAIGYALGLLSVIGILTMVFRFQLAALFSSDAAVINVTAHLLILCGLVQPFNALSIVGIGALNGAGDTRIPFFFSLTTMWLVRIVFSQLLGFTFGFGVMGVYFSMILDLFVRSVLLLLRFKSNRWATRTI